MDTNLKKFIDLDEKNIRLASKQGQIDGAAESPSSESSGTSEWESRLVSEIASGWKRYKDSCEHLKADITDRFHDISAKSERDFAKSEESLGQKHKNALDFLDVDIGESSKAYQSLRVSSEAADIEYAKGCKSTWAPCASCYGGGVYSSDGTSCARRDTGQQAGI